MIVGTVVITLLRWIAINGIREKNGKHSNMVKYIEDKIEYIDIMDECDF